MGVMTQKDRRRTLPTLFGPVVSGAFGEMDTRGKGSGKGKRVRWTEMEKRMNAIQSLYARYFGT
jgi:hypothetical protein